MEQIEERKGGFTNIRLKEQPGNHGQGMTTNPGHGEAVQVSAMDRFIEQAIAKGDLSIIEKFMELRNREVDRERKYRAEMEFANAMADFQSHCPAIRKNSEVDYEHKDKGGKTNFWYVDIDGIIETVKRPLGNAGLSFSWRVKEGEKGEITVTCILSHRGGHTISDTLTGTPDTSGGKAGLHAKASTITYLRRYTLTNVLGISTGGKDDDGRLGAGLDDDSSGRTETINRIPSSLQVENIIAQIKAGQTTLDEQSGIFSFTKSQLEVIKFATEPEGTNTNF